MRRIFCVFAFLLAPSLALAQAQSQPHYIYNYGPTISLDQYTARILMQQGSAAAPYTYTTPNQILNSGFPAAFGTLGATGLATLNGGVSTTTLTTTGLATLSGGIAFGGTSSGVLAGAGVSLNLGTGAATLGVVTVGSAAATLNAFSSNTLFGVNAGASLPSNDTESTAFGYRALWKMTGTTAENTAIGWQSQAFETTATFNTSVGVNTMGANISGQNMVAVGTDAMRDTTASSNSVAIGAPAMRDWNCQFCIAIGVSALNGNTDGTSTGGSNIAIGYEAMMGNGSANAQNMVVIGDNSAPNITSANIGVIIGDNAGNALTSGGNNTLIGFNAGKSISTSNENTIIGNSAGTLATGSNSTLIGYNTGAALTTGANNTMIGQNSGTVLTIGGFNTLIGEGVASTTLQTGGHNIVIGVNNFADTPAANTNDMLVIQGNGTTPTIEATGMASTNPQVQFPGSAQIGGTALTLAAGEWGLPKITVSGTAPGASGGKLALVCGTNAGTAKLVIYAGTSTAPVTILDNIGSGLSGC